MGWPSLQTTRRSGAQNSPRGSQHEEKMPNRHLDQVQQHDHAVTHHQGHQQGYRRPCGGQMEGTGLQCHPRVLEKIWTQLPSPGRRSWPRRWWSIWWRRRLVPQHRKQPTLSSQFRIRIRWPPRGQHGHAPHVPIHGLHSGRKSSGAQTKGEHGHRRDRPHRKRGPSNSRLHR